MHDSGHFRFTREFFLHHIEQGNAARFLEMILTNAYSYQSKLKTITEQEVGFDRPRRAAFQALRSNPIPWHLSYRVRIGIKCVRELEEELEEESLSCLPDNVNFERNRAKSA